MIGVRTRATRSDDSSWRKGQEVAQRRYALLPPVLGVGALVALANGLASGPYWVFITLVAVTAAIDAVIAATAVSAAGAAARREGRGRA